MTSNTLHPALDLVQAVIRDFDGSGIYSVGCSAALNAMVYHWKDHLAQAHHSPEIISEDIDEMMQRLEVMRAEIMRRLYEPRTVEPTAGTSSTLDLQDASPILVDRRKAPPPAALLNELIGDVTTPVNDAPLTELPHLIPDHPEQSGADFILRQDAKSAWVTVGNISVHIIRHDDGVEVITHPKSCEDQELDSLYACFDTAEESLTDYHGIDLDDVAEWVGLHYGRNFDAEPVSKRHAWILRYIENNAETLAP